MVICLERGADLHKAQLMPLSLTVSCFSEIQIDFTFLVPAHPGSPGKRAVKQVCVCVLRYILHAPLQPDQNAGSFANILSTLVWSVLCLHTSETFHNSQEFTHIEK